MRIIFCANPLNIKLPDDQYQQEFHSAGALGLQCNFIDYEALSGESNPDRAVRLIVPANAHEKLLAIYRGWMLPPEKYQNFYDALASKNIHLINTVAQYKHCHHLPEWLPAFESFTPQTVWISKEQINNNWLELLMKTLAPLAGQSIIVKDFVKSEKHRWHEACFIPDSSDLARVERITRRFLELRGENLEGGLVFRKFEQFKPLSTHSKSGMPLTREYRLFVLDGQIVHWIPYWEEGIYEQEGPPLDFFSTLAQKVQSRFFTMDVAQTVDDRWLVVELGDAQVAGLPENADTDAFYNALLTAL